jgi:hypothetical protein
MVFIVARPQLPDQLCSYWAAAAPPSSLRLPPHNPYIATDFSLRCLGANGGVSQTMTWQSPAAASADGGDAACAAAGAEPPQKTAVAEAEAAEARDASALAAKLGLPLVMATPPRMVVDKPGGWVAA